MTENTTTPVVLTIASSAYNEAGNVRAFLNSAWCALCVLKVPGEILLIDDGSADETAAVVKSYAKAHPEIPVRLVRHSRRLGITHAIQELTTLARGSLICFISADLESLPEEDIPLLFEAMDQNTDIVAGWRQERADGKVLASRLYNRLNRWLFGVDLHDANWIKLIRREKLIGVKLLSDWHRFLVPILVYRGCRVKEVPTRWHRRKFGQSNFGIGRLPGALVDLITIKILLDYNERPMVLFGMIGLALWLLSLLPLWCALAADELTTLVGGFVVFAALLVGGTVSFIAGLGVEFLLWSSNANRCDISMNDASERGML